MNNHRDWVLKVLRSSGPRQQVRQQLLSTLAKGNWKRQDRAEHYVPPGVEVDTESLKEVVVQGL
eukprot:11713595-Prorocentrum_lima.AAC.1